jgi:Zinc knuckle
MATHSSCLDPWLNTALGPLLEYMVVARRVDERPRRWWQSNSHHSPFESCLRPSPSSNKMSRFAPHKLSNSNPRATQDTVCQKCLGRGHYTYNCKVAAVPYKSRPSRTQMLENPDKYSDVLSGKRAGGPSVDVPEEFLGK